MGQISISPLSYDTFRNVKNLLKSEHFIQRKKNSF